VDLASILNFLVFLTIGASYGTIGGQHAGVVDERLEARTNQHLGIFAFILISILWPVSVVLWAASCLMTRQALPGPFTHDVRRARLDAEMAEVEMRRDWESRAAFWYAEGQRAEKEDNQALKWLVAEQLAFLLDTRPDGVQTPEEKAKKDADREALEKAKHRERGKQALAEIGRTKKRQVPSLYTDVRMHREGESPTVDWPALRKKFDAKVRQAPTHHTPSIDKRHSGSVSFCNICHRYRSHESLALKGVCRECSEEQGLG
jgi:hypothetical protein